MKKRTKARIIIYLFTFILVGTILSIAMFSGRVEAEIVQQDGNYYLEIKSTYLFDSIQDKRFIADFDISFWQDDHGFEIGQKVGGISSVVVKSGDYTDGSLQTEYRLHSYAKTKSMIVLEKKSSTSPSIIAFNLGSDKATKEFYEKLKGL